MNIYKVFYFRTKKYDINIIISASKRNYFSWGYEIEKHHRGFQIHMGKCHVHYNKYPHEHIGNSK